MSFPPGTPDASTYRFLTTNILTGKVMCDSLPIVGQSATRTINSIGQFEGSLQIQGDAPQAIVNNWVQSVVPWKSVLWILQDDYPIWNGPITSWNPTTITSGTLPIQAATMEEMFQHRVVTDNLSFVSLDIFEIFRNELLYALGKTPNGQIAGSGRYANQSGIIDSVQESGVIGDVVELTSLKTIYECFTDLVNNYGLEYALTPMVTDAGASLYTMVQLGLPLLGRPYSQTGLQFVFPSKGAIDYAWQAISTFPANRVIVSGQGAPNPTTGAQTTYISQTPHGESIAELNQGFPLMEDSYGLSNTVTSQAQINSFADNVLPGLTITNSLTPYFIMGSTARPRIRDVQLGDEAMVGATSPLHPAQGPNQTPGVIAKFRLSSWELTFPAEGQDEQAQFTLGNGLAVSLSGNLSSDIFSGGTGAIPE